MGYLYLNNAFDNKVLTRLSQAAEEYEYNIFRQSVHLHIKKGDPNYDIFYGPKGGLSTSLKKKNWKGFLRNWLRSANPNIEQYDSMSNLELADALDKAKTSVENWLINTTEGTEYIQSLGISVLIDELKNGKWINTDKNGNLIVGAKIENIGGLRKEATILLGLKDWLTKQDPNGVVADTVDFKGRHQEGRFDILMKFTKDETFESRRPIRIEAKTSINNFVIGTMIEDLLSSAMLQVTTDSTKTGLVRVIFSKEKLQDVIDKFLENKYSQGGEYGMSNILPIFSSGQQVLLFSDFIEKTKDNLFLAIPESVRQFKAWAQLRDQGLLPTEYLEVGTRKLNNKIIRRKLASRLTYGKPSLK